MIIGIVGFGFVGKATSILTSSRNLLIYDINPELCKPKNLDISQLSKCQVIFVSVPTPMNNDGTVYTNIVEDTVNKLKEIKEDNCPIIIRSTVPPGLSDKLGVCFMPEFLTEKNYLEDFKNSKEWIIGYPSNMNPNHKVRIEYLFENAYKNKYINSEKIIYLKNKEAEMVKYFKNNFLSLKVSFCNEIYSFCQNREINYENVINAVTLDSRITDSHTKVPGHDGKFGYGGTCFPKDCAGLLAEFKKYDVPSYVIESCIKRNNELDRKEQDWNDNKGRAVI